MKELQEMENQRRLFEILKEKIPPKYTVAQTVSNLLKISIESAQRRVNCKQELTMSEFTKISKEYKISVDAIIYEGSNQSIVFKYSPIELDNADDYMKYIEKISEILIYFKKKYNEIEFTYTAQDIPVYHFYKFPELGFFRLYIWYNIKAKNKKTFKEFYENLDKEKILNIYKSLNKTIENIPAKEIWTEHTIDNTLSLFEFYYDAGVFITKVEALIILEQLKSLVNEIEQIAEKGYKENTDKTPFYLYNCSTAMESNLSLIKCNNKYYSHIKLFTVNLLETENDILCTEIKSWIDSIISKSILISGDGALKERIQFFNTAKTKIQKMIEKVNI